MYEVEPQVLHERAEMLAAVLTEFDQEHPGELHDLNFVEQREYEDLCLVFLGLKPATTPIGSGQELHPDLIDLMAKALGEGADAHLRVEYQWNMPQVIWNPELVRRVLGEHPDMESAQAVLEALDGGEALTQYLFWLDSSEEVADRALSGMLFGFPPAAAEGMMDLTDQMVEIIHGLAYGERRQYRQEIPVGWVLFDTEDSPNPPDRDRFGGRGPREIFLEECDRLVAAGQLDQAFVDQVRQLHPANVPGNPYITLGDATVLDEGKLRSQWALAGIQGQLNHMFGVVE